MNYAIGLGMQGLYQSVSRNERQKEDMGYLRELYSISEKEKADNIVAQEKYAEYEKQVHDFADKLLGPDRTKINNKAKQLSQSIRDEILNYGGDMKKFLANGGTLMMNDYKNNVINSPEASRYASNKENSVYVIKAMSEGKGHLINQRDLNNWQKYGETGDGEITYTGLYNEIEMPDANNYDWQQEIPAEDILDKNYFQIYGNFVMDYPDIPNPSRTDLLSYTASLYGGKGANWQRQYQMEVERNRHLEKISQNKIDLIKQLSEKEKATNKKYKADGTEIPNSNSEDFKDDAVGEFHYEFANVPKDLTIDDVVNKPGQWMPEILQRITQPISVEESLLKDDNLYEKGILGLDWKPSGYDKGSSVFGKLSDNMSDFFIPKDARRLVDHPLQADLVRSLFPDAEIDTNSKDWKNYKPSDKVFLPNGQKASSNSDKIDWAAYDSPFHIKDVLVGLTSRDEKNNLKIVMDKFDRNGKADKNNISEVKAVHGKSTLEPKILIVMEDEKGRTFIETVDPLDKTVMSKIQKNLGSYSDRGSLVKDAKNREVIKNYNTILKTNLEKESSEYWNLVNTNPNAFKTVELNARKLDKEDGKLVRANIDFYKSFYAGLAQNFGAFSSNEFETFANDPNNNIEKFLSEIDAKGFKFKGIDNKQYSIYQLLSDKKYSGNEILEQLYSWVNSNMPEAVPLIEKWIQNYTHLKK